MYCISAKIIYLNNVTPQGFWMGSVCEQVYSLELRVIVFTIAFIKTLTKQLYSKAVCRPENVPFETIGPLSLTLLLSVPQPTGLSDGRKQVTHVGRQS